MNYDVVQPTVNSLLNNLKVQKILIFHNSHLKKYARRELMRIKFNELQISAIRKISDALINHTTTLSSEEISALMTSINLANIITMLEDLKNTISDLLDKTKIKLDDNPTYGVLINRIANKLNYTDKQRSELSEVFLIDLRNIIAHSDYELSANKITFNNKSGKLEEYTMFDLANLFWVLNEIKRTILNFQGIDTAKGQIGSSIPYKTPPNFES